jgi:hypothetical protein
MIDCLIDQLNKRKNWKTNVQTKQVYTNVEKSTSLKWFEWNLQYGKISSLKVFVSQCSPHAIWSKIVRSINQLSDESINRSSIQSINQSLDLHINKAKAFIDSEVVDGACEYLLGTWNVLKVI